MDSHRRPLVADAQGPLRGGLESFHEDVAFAQRPRAIASEPIVAAIVLAVITSLVVAMYARPATALWREIQLEWGDWLARLAVVALCVVLTPWSALRLRAEIDLRGLAGIAAACALFLFGQLSADFFTTRISFAVLLAALMVTFGGLPALRVPAVSLIALAGAMPIPLLLQTQGIAPLRAVAVAVANRLVDWCGGVAYVEAGTMWVPTGGISIADVCSDLRLLGSIFAIALLFALRDRRGWLPRILLVACALPLSIAVDAVHLTMVALVADAPAAQVFESSHFILPSAFLLGTTAILWALARTGAVHR